MKSDSVTSQPFSSEQAIQDWLENLIENDCLYDAIEGKEEVSNALLGLEDADFWPSFPIDHLTRIASLRSASYALERLHTLQLISKNNRNISLERGERMFADLLYCSPETSTFVLFEVKHNKGTSREAITELLAYEHEIQNHIPFSGASDIITVVVSRDYPTLLDHAVASGNTWSRKQMLCLLFEEDDQGPKLKVHIPNAWSAIGQIGLPFAGLPTATLSLAPKSDLNADDIFSAFSTAAELFVREAERKGGSGFAMVCYNHFSTKLADSPYLLLIGAVDPFTFIDHANNSRMLENSASPILDYLLEGERHMDLSTSWDWLSSDGGAATDYLKEFGRPTWEMAANWRHLRDVRRWKSNSITFDRHISPVYSEFWGFLGDFVREIARRPSRLRAFMPGFAKPQMNWKHPLFGTLLLDELSGHHALKDGQWTFSAVFQFGLCLGRLGAFSSHFSEADPDTKDKLLAPMFWSQADALPFIHEVGLRYISAREIEVPPPKISLSEEMDAADIMEQMSAFAQWFQTEFLNDGEELMQQAFGAAVTIYSIFDEQFDPHGDNPETVKLREMAAKWAKHWLKWSVVEALSEHRDAEAAVNAIEKEMNGLIPLESGKELSFEAIEALDTTLLVSKLFQAIPRIVDSWHPQVSHTLAPLTQVSHDWAWYKEQIERARDRGEQHPCIFLSAGGQMGIGKLPDEFPAPRISDPSSEVLLVDNQSGYELTTVVTWDAIMAGKVPGTRNNGEGGKQ